MENKISVIMACYNCEKTMDKAIESILNQTYDNWVMICCDDGSNDRTWEILQSYKGKYPEKFMLLKNETNKQLPYSLNRCLECVETEYVARMDADDWSLPKRFEMQINYLKEHPEVDLVGTGLAVFDGEKQIASIIREPNPTKESMLNSNAFSHATIMTHRRVYDELNGYSLDPTVIRVEDVDLWCRFFAAGFKGYNLQEELYVILEDINAVKRRTLRARINSAKTRARGYRLMGFSGFACYRAYFSILKAFVPASLYQMLHAWRLKKQTGKI